MKTREWNVAATALFCLAILCSAVGCEYGTPNPEAASTGTDQNDTEGATTDGEDSESGSSDADEQESDDSPEASSDEQASAPARETVREEAKVGMGRKGHYEGEGVVLTPVKIYWRVGEKVKLLQIQDQMNKYKALHGEAPKSHEEFMEKIVKPLRIELPPLYPDERYVYVPEKEMLMVEKPKK